MIIWIIWTKMLVVHYFDSFGVIWNIIIIIIKTIRMIQMTVMVLLVTLIASSALQLEMEWAGEGIRRRWGRMECSLTACTVTNKS